LRFPTTYPGVPGPAVPVTLIAGDDPLSIGSVRVAGADASSFEIRSDDCTGSTLLAGDTCTAFVRFLPSRPGPHVAHLLVADTTTPGRHEVRVTGMGISGHTGVTLDSEPGEYVSGGMDRAYDPSSAAITASGTRSGVVVRAESTTDDWYLDFRPPSGDVLVPGGFSATPETPASERAVL
jgi:hypothetical protein